MGQFGGHAGNGYTYVKNGRMHVQLWLNLYSYKLPK